MAGLLLYDLMKPSTESKEDTDPYGFLHVNAFHGGSWRCAYEGETIGKAGYIFGRFGYAYSAVDHA